MDKRLSAGITLPSPGLALEGQGSEETPARWGLAARRRTGRAQRGWRGQLI